ncbi:MAG: hypothetical protein E4H44_00645 [Candidatus Aminicenantes bacterium]|nr:MAG: hypothetical protein E4H44_00645 [Candidatus Aminicenantes bacterium]
MAVTGNPVHPYLADVFIGGEEITADDGDHVTSGIGTFSLDSSKMMTALTMGTFSRRGRAGDLGPVHLMFMPLILWWAWRHRKKTETWVVIGFVALGTMAWAAGPPLGRYLFPILAVSAGLIGASWSDGYASWSTAARRILTALLFVILAANCNPARDQNLFNQVRCFLGAGDSEDYLTANCSQIEPFRAAEALLPPEAKVLLVGEPRPFQIDRDVVVEDQFRVPLLVELANDSSTAEEIADRLRDMGVTHLLWNADEAARIAEAEHREGYLICDGSSAQARLDRFLEEFTSPVESGEWWAIMELSRR